MRQGVVKFLLGLWQGISICCRCAFYDLIRHAKALAEKEILLIGGWQDRTATVEAYVLPLYRSLQNNGAKNVKIVVYDTNHSFRNVRDLLANEIISWIKGEQ